MRTLIRRTLLQRPYQVVLTRSQRCLLFVLLASFGAVLPGRSDFTNYWLVSLNGRQLHQITEFDSARPNLKLPFPLVSDTLTVRYVSDTPVRIAFPLSR